MAKNKKIPQSLGALDKPKKSKKVNPAYLSPQSPTTDSSQTTEDKYGEGDNGTILMDGKSNFRGESSNYGDGDKFSWDVHKLSNMRIATGTNKSLYGVLKSMRNQLMKGGMMDSRDGKLCIHNHHFNQTTKLHYTYMGGNGELLRINFKTQKRTAPLEATSSSKIDPETKAVDTTVKQSMVLHQRQYQPLSTEDANSRGLQYNWDPKGYANPNILSPANIDNLNSFATKNKRGDYSTPEARRKLSYEYKFEKEARDDISKNYQVTQDDVTKYISDVKSKFDAGMASLTNNSDFEPLLKSCAIGKFLVKKQVRVKTWLNPFNYSHEPGSATNGTGEHPIGSYEHGLEMMRSNPNIVILDTNSKGHVAKSDYDKSVNIQGYKYGPAVLGIADKVVDVEIDGARVFSAATPQQVANMYADNDILDAVTKQVYANMSTIGRPEMCTSMVIGISNVSNKYSGNWYTKKVKHSCMPGYGYTCEAQMIPSDKPVTISTTHTRIHLPSVYNEINKVAKEKVSRNNSVDVTSTVKQSLKDYYKNHPEISEDQKKNTAVTTRQTDTGLVIQIYNAKGIQTETDITKKREKILNK